jgi:hypothetical protein
MGQEKEIKTIETVEELQAKLAVLEAEKEASNKLIAEQAVALAKAESNIGKDTPSFENDGVTYDVVIPKFKFEKVEYTAADVVENTDLQTKLIEQGSGVIKERVLTA